ncbi:protein-tyrosine phosphatase-like protein [Bipolaris maydis]|nr:protein-tyrosine phosphatase-like protein [Bipolaris maydis]KAJ6202871.1 protein-tyrosine phosphatase-like protein [Bipolaris maydis]
MSPTMSTEPTQPLPNPPFYTIPNINNLRDASISLTTTSGSSIRPRILFRSAEVSKLDFAGWQAVHSLGVSHVFDLRSKPEVDKGWAGIVGKDASGDGDDDVRPGWLQAMEQAGVARSWVPVFEESDYSPERLAERYSKYMDEAVTGFVDAYRDILANGGSAFGNVLKYLAAITAVGALVHCTAGKDRTGMFFGLLFDFLGVPREQIADEYQLTELGLAHVRDEVVARLMQSPGFNKYMLASMEGTKLSVEDIATSLKGEERQVQVQVPPEVLEKGRQAALRMIGARKESMLRSLEMLDEVFGGAERYLKEKCGLSDHELDALRRNLLVEGQAV